jgi:hypothetical protein
MFAYLIRHISRGFVTGLCEPFLGSGTMTANTIAGAVRKDGGPVYRQSWGRSPQKGCRIAPDLRLAPSWGKEGERVKGLFQPLYPRVSMGNNTLSMLFSGGGPLSNEVTKTRSRRPLE